MDNILTFNRFAMRKHYLIFLGIPALFSLLAALAVFNRPGVAQSETSILLTVEAGYDGLCKEATWIPIRAVVENKGAGVEARLEANLDVNGSKSTFAYTLSLPSQSRKEVFLYLYPEAYASSLEIRLVAGKQILARQNPRLTFLSNNDLLFGVIAGSSSPFNILVELDPPNGKANVAQLALQNLPENSQALEALDALFISNVDTGSFSTAQQQALLSWIAGGGQLIVAGGPHWQKTAAGLSDLLPLRPIETQSLSSLQALTGFGYIQAPLEDTGQEILAAKGSLSENAEVLLEQDGLPLVIWRPLGYGGVFYLAADPALPPLAGWAGMADFYANLLSWRTDLPGWADGFQNWDSVQSAAASLPAMRYEYLLLICCFLGAYVMAIGPLNFLALRFLKRRELAWISIPILVIFFSGLSFLVGGATRGRQPVINRLAVVQTWTDNGSFLPQARVNGILGVYAPRRAAYNLETGKSEGWLLRPLPQMGIASSRDLLILQDNSGTLIPDLRIEIGSIYPLVIEGQTSAPSFASDLRLEISPQGLSLDGAITNNSSLTLKDAVLFYPGGTLKIGDFLPGQTYTVHVSPTKAQPSGIPENFPYSYYSYGSYYGAQGTTLQDIIGGSNYYDDPDLYRRYQLLSGLLSPYYQPRERGGGIYLSGWSNHSPLDLQITNSHPRFEDTTLYLIAIAPDVQITGNTLRLTPGAFVWKAMWDSIGTPLNIYEDTIYAGDSHRYTFTLARPIAYRSIRSLTLHLYETGSVAGSPTPLEIWLWDYSRQDWARLPMETWGNQPIPDPENYVGPGGSIRLRLDNPSAQTISLKQADFTLEVTP